MSKLYDLHRGPDLPGVVCAVCPCWRCRLRDGGRSPAATPRPTRRRRVLRAPQDSGGNADPTGCTCRPKAPALHLHPCVGRESPGMGHMYVSVRASILILH